MIAEEILNTRDLIAIGARADEERRKRHGVRTTFVRVLEIHADAIPSTLPSIESAGEIRLIGTPASIADATSAVRAARAIAGSVPLTAFSLADLVDLADRLDGLGDVFAALVDAGLNTIAEAPIDLLPDPIESLRLAHESRLKVPRLTVHRMEPEARQRLVERAREIQSAIGGVQVFAPLARVMSIAQPSTGYDDVRQIAMARLLVDNIDSIQVDWPLYGPKLAQVALTMGADDVDGVSALPGTLGRRRSPIEEILGNIKGAGLEPVERNGRFEARGR